MDKDVASTQPVTDNPNSTPDKNQRVDKKSYKSREQRNVKPGTSQSTQPVTKKMPVEDEEPSSTTDV